MISERRPRQSRGAALIVALLVVATVVILAVTVNSDFLLMFRRVENQIYSEQAYAYLLGAEGAARAALLQDGLQDKKLGKAEDTLAEDWVKPQKFPTDYGWIAGQLEDMQGRFNLNALIPQDDTAQKVGNYNEPQRMLIRLLQTLPLQEPLALDQAEALVDAITDWIDTDDIVTGLGGAESQYYADADPPGRPANRAILSPSELMWVRGMTPEIYRALAPLVTVWPYENATLAVNINTAPSAVLRSVNEAGNLAPLEENSVEKILAQREAQGRIEVSIFASSGLTKPDVDALVVASRYFQLTAQTEFEGRRYTLRSIIRREDDSIRVVARTFGEW